MDLKKFTRLKTQIDSLRQRVERAQGALDQLTKQLSESHGCRTVAEARRKLIKLEKRVKRSEKLFADGLAAFEEKWSGELEEEG